MRTTCKAALLAVASFFILAGAFAQSQVAKTIPNSTSPDGVIGFLEFKPNDYGSQKHPLIIFLHGVAERGNGTSQIGFVAYNALPNTLQTGYYNMRFTANGQTSSFVVISPQLSAAYGYWPSWYISEIIKYAKANLSIDPNRIYVTGLSLGGGGVLRMMTDAYGQDPSFDSQIAAVAPVCSTPEQSDADYCRTVGANHLPIWGFHCMDDINVTPAVTQHIQALSQACGVTPTSKFSYYAYGGHGGAWINAYDFGHITTLMGDGSTVTFNQNLFEWFLTNTRSGVVTPPTNTPPTVSVSGGQLITLPTNAVTVVGSAAGTNGATISSYSWTQTGGPAGANIVSPGSTTTNINNLSQGVYTFTFTARDNNNLTASGNVIITVNPAVAGNTPPTVSVSSAQTITLPANAVTISGTATGTNGATISSYAWTQTGGSAGPNIVSPGSSTTNITGLTQGTYVFTLTARDNNNLTASGSVTITVNPSTGGSQPTASIGGSNVSITLPVSSVTLDGSASTGNIVQYYWFQAQGPIPSVVGNNFSAVTTATGLTTPGTYIYVLQVVDNLGAHLYSQKVVTVNPSGTVPVVPSCVTNTSPTNGSTLTTQTTATLTWPASSGATSYDVYLQAGTGLPVTLVTNTAALTYSAAGLSAGTAYSWYIAPRNASGVATTCASANKTTFTTAAAGVQPTASNGGSDVTITLPVSSITLDGSASTGNIVQYYWFQAVGPIPSVVGNNFSKVTTATGLTTPGTYIYVLQVIDNLGAHLYSQKVVTVKAAGTRVADGSITDGVALVPGGDLPAPGAAGKLVIMYPNPVVNSTNIELNSTADDVKKISLYNSAGVLVNSYRWPVVKGKNIYSLKNVAGLASGLYIIHITDSKGKITGTLKFVKA